MICILAKTLAETDRQLGLHEEAAINNQLQNGQQA